MLDRKPNLKVGGGDFDPIPMGKYTVQIADVNFVNQFNKWKGEEVEMLNYRFVVLDDIEMAESEEDATTRGRFLWLRVNESLNKKSKLYKLAAAALKRDLTEKELDPENKKFFHPESIIGMQVLVMVSEDEKDGRTYNNIIDIKSVKRELEPVEIEDKKPMAVTKTVTKSAIEEAIDDSDEEEEEEQPKKAVKKKSGNGIDVPDLMPGLNQFVDDDDDESEEEEQPAPKKKKVVVETDDDDDDDEDDEELKKFEEEAAKARKRLEEKKAEKKARK